MDWSLVIGSSGLAGVAYLIFKIGRFTQHIDSSFSDLKRESRELRMDIDKKYAELRADVSDIKDRLTFMEAFLFFSGIGPEPAKTHSERMKKAWEKRRMKEVEVKEK